MNKIKQIYTLKLKRNFLLLILNCFWIASYAQSTIEFKQLKGENVPTQSIIYAIDTDSIGNVWIASEEGVLKHNSKYYTIYNSYNGLPTIFGNRIKEVFVDSKQRVWIGSEEGVSIYNENSDAFEYIETDGVLNPSLIEVIIEDDNKDIWVGGYNGLWKYDEINKKLKRIVSNHNIQALYPLSNKIIFGTQKGLFFYESDFLQDIEIGYDEKNIRHISKFGDDILIGTKTGKLYLKQEGDKNIKRIDFDFNLFNAITDIIKTSDGSFLMATDGDGIYKLNTDYKKIEQYTEDPNEPYSISSNGVYDIKLDREGILWIATYGGGLNYHNSSELPFQNIRHRINDENSLVANFTRAITKDKNGDIWFGTKKGISIWNKDNNTWRHIKNFNSSNKNEDVIVLSLERDDDYIWVGTYNQGLFKININSLSITNCNTQLSDKIVQKVYAIKKDSKGNVWVGGIEKNLTVISSNNSISTYPIQQIKSIVETNSGDILTSGRHGVFKINHQLKTFGFIEDLLPSKNSLAYSTVNTVVETEDNTLVLATNGEGIVFYNPKDKSIKRLKVNSGMPSDIIQGVILNSKDNIWVSTTKGLANIKMTKTDTIVNVYDKKDGLASTEFNYGSFKKLDDDVMAFGGVDGVTVFKPNEVKNESYKPRLVFDTFKISNKIIRPSDEPLKQHINKTKRITLKHTENSIEIHFSGVLHSSSSKVKYSWQLEGFDETWSVPTNTNFATYTNLNPGYYTFKVKAGNKYDSYSDVRQLKILIDSPWWATNKAYFLYFLAFIGLLYAIIHFTSFVIKKKNADDQIDFFNNITHEIKTPLTILISSLDNVTDGVTAADDSKKRIKTTVKRINALFEQMLNFQKVTTKDDATVLDISRIDVLSQIQQRIKNFEPLTKSNNIKIVVNNNFNDDFYFDKDAFDKIMLNLLSNAIKYSFENSTITVSAKKTETGNLELQIADEGVGIPEDQQKFILKRYFRARNAINSQRPGTGLGLMMVKKLIEKTNGSIHFTSEENKGTTFTIHLKNFSKEYKGASSNSEKTPRTKINTNEDESDLLEYSDSKILVVEDNNELRQLLVERLGNYFQVFEATNGNEGFEQAKNIFPDIILTDLIMPKLDGLEMSKKLKADISLNHIPIFMLTVLQNSEQKLESVEIGISEYLEKPVDIKYLLAKITNTLKWQRKLRKKYVQDNDFDRAEVFRNKNDQEFLTNLENKVIENIENNNFSVHDLSSSFGMSRTSLYMKLKNLVDLSPQDFVIHTKLKHAKNLLIRGEFSIKEVAYQSGFSNPKYFSTSFKKFYGMTPTGFLDSLKK